MKTYQNRIKYKDIEKDHFFCSRKCASRYGAEKAKESDMEKDLEWNSDIAYLCGLIASDGHISRKYSEVDFTSTDEQLVKNVKYITENYIIDDNSDISKVKTKDKHRDRYKYSIYSHLLYYFLNDVGIKHNKTQKISSVSVPDKFFPDFIKGEFEGDGTICLVDGNYVSSIYSGSREYLEWIYDNIKRLNKNITGGSIGTDKRNNVSYSLNFGLEDTKYLSKFMYNNSDLVLERKYNKCMEASEYEFKGRTINRDTAREIYKRAHSSETNIEIAEDYPITRSTVSNIKCGYTWEHATKDIDV